MRSAIFAIAFAALFCSAFGFFTPDQAKALLFHNDLRKEVGLGHLEWSFDLSREAAAYARYLEKANQCRLKESTIGQRRGRGENIAWNPDGSIEKAAIEWAKQKENFVPGKTVISFTNIPKVGAYTQQVWKSTKQVGCGASECGIVVCRYYPTGNWLDQSPF